MEDERKEKRRKIGEEGEGKEMKRGTGLKFSRELGVYIQCLVAIISNFNLT